MGIPAIKYQFNLNEEERKIVDENLGLDTVDKKQRTNAIKKFILSQKIEHDLTTKEKIELEKLKQLEAKNKRIEETESLKLRKLEAETELTERQLNYTQTFNKTPTPTAQKAMKKGIDNKVFGNSTTGVGYDVNVQAKKNFYINRFSDGTYCGACKICRNFSTDICSTSKEAEYDIETHLQIVHQQELYQK